MKKNFISVLGIFVLASALGLWGCSSDTAGSSGECSENSHCDSGEVCLDKECVLICQSDSNCGDGMICVSDACVEGVRTGLPSITTINGDGNPTGDLTDSRGQMTANLLQASLIIMGNNLEGTSVYLDSSSSDSIALSVTTSSATELVASVPTTLLEGYYTLRVQNSVGEAQTTVWILQGEAGADGAPDTGAEIIAKINADSSVLIDASKITAVDAATLDGLAASDLSLADHSHLGEYARLVDGGVGTANPYFAEGLAAWTITDGSGSVVDDAASPSGKAVANTANEMLWIHNSDPIPVDPTQMYRVEGWFKNTTTTSSAGEIFLAVQLNDATGANIAGDGLWWYYPKARIDLTDDVWHRYKITFGRGTNRGFPAEAATMTVGAVLNYDNSNAGNRELLATGLSVRPVEDIASSARQRLERYQAIC
ncbi:hypothetical protein KAI87_14010, partial [Myxococcota bacterium]|nr:hypothetical protein [Myxococcota bacterium]